MILTNYANDTPRDLFQFFTYPVMVIVVSKISVNDISIKFLMFYLSWKPIFISSTLHLHSSTRLISAVRNWSEQSSWSVDLVVRKTGGISQPTNWVLPLRTCQEMFSYHLVLLRTLDLLHQITDRFVIVCHFTSLPCLYATFSCIDIVDISTK